MAHWHSSTEDLTTTNRLFMGNPCKVQVRVEFDARYMYVCK